MPGKFLNQYYVISKKIAAKLLLLNVTFNLFFFLSGDHLVKLYDVALFTFFSFLACVISVLELASESISTQQPRI